MASSPFDRRAIPTGATIGVWHAEDGWPLRRFDWPATGPVRGSILFQGGRGDVVEKYLETLAHWHAQGWNISWFDWRGQSGSGRVNGAKSGHIEDFADYVADYRGFAREWQATTPGPHVVMGHSMGGHLVLRALVERAIRPDAAVLVAPMLGLRSPLGMASLGERFARLMGGLGDPARAAWKDNERPYTIESRQSLLTHDRERYQDELWWQKANPANVTGPPSWKWLIEAFRSTRELRDSPALANMDVPLLALVAEHDGLVDAKAGLATLARLPGARIVRFGPESAHEILREADAVRDRAIGEIDRFLEAQTPQR
ncbi:alpha/beta hydrolase [Sphingomonas sp.]|uniref:alpha/beta hydrolase n=1 Tax=Sphingomonas sp. TaxID=28214 RepID=UPI002EDA9619